MTWKQKDTTRQWNKTRPDRKTHGEKVVHFKMVLSRVKKRNPVTVYTHLCSPLLLLSFSSFLKESGIMLYLWKRGNNILKGIEGEVKRASERVGAPPQTMTIKSFLSPSQPSFLSPSYMAEVRRANSAHVCSFFRNRRLSILFPFFLVFCLGRVLFLILF